MLQPRANQAALSVVLLAAAVNTLYGVGPANAAPRNRPSPRSPDVDKTEPLTRYWVFKSRQSRLSPNEEQLKQINRRFRQQYVLPVTADPSGVYFTSRIDHRAGCLDAATGRLRWTFTADAAIWYAPTLHDGRVYFGSDDGCVYCLEAATGRLLWKIPPPRDRCILSYSKIVSAWPVRTNVLIDGGVAYFGSGVFPHDGTFVTAVDPKTGRVIWRNGTVGETPYEWDALSPVGYLSINEQGQLFVPNDEMRPLLFDVATGQLGPKPKQRHSPIFHPTPALPDGRRFGSTLQGEVFCEGPQPTAKCAEIQEPVDEHPFKKDAAQANAAAKTTLALSGVKQGHALVLDGVTGAFALALARQSELDVYVVFSDRDKANAAREKLQRTGLYGSRVTVRYQPPETTIPYPACFADLIVSEATSLQGRLPDRPWASVYRLLKPIRGVALIGGKTATSDLAIWTRHGGTQGWELSDKSGAWAKHIRPRLADGGGWTHHYADAGASGCSHDGVLRPPLGVVWYGQPFADNMVNRSGVPPMIVEGLLIAPEAHAIGAYDAYTGRRFWFREMKYLSRKNPFGGTSNLAANRKHLFIIYGHECLKMDIQTGEELKRFTVPGGGPWGWLACDETRLYGSRGSDGVSNGLFTFDAESGKNLWTYADLKDGKPQYHFQNNSIVVGDGGLYFIIDGFNDETKKQALEETKTHIRTYPEEERKRIEAELDQRDTRILVALDAATGQPRYWRGVDVTDCGGAAQNVEGAQRRKYPLGAAYRDGVLLHFNITAGGKYWGNWANHRWAWRAIAARDVRDGKLLWMKPVNFKSRPVIIDETVHAEPWALHLRTGQFKIKPHPITGQATKWTWCRYGKHCGIFCASKNFLFGRSGGIGYHDLINDRGSYTFMHSRPSCWFDTVSGGGLMIKPPMSRGCSCVVAASFTVALGQVDAEPATSQIATAWGPTLPVKQLNIDFGASGDRFDHEGNLWLAPTVPRIPKIPVLWFHIVPEFYEGGGRSIDSAMFTDFRDAKPPFVFASYLRGMRKFVVPLTETDEGAAEYDVHLAFAAPPGDRPGERTFDVKLQGKTVLKGLDIAKEGGGPQRAIWREFSQISCKKDLTLELVAPIENPTPAAMPIINGLRIERRGR